MPNLEIEKVVDGMIQSGRISRDMRDIYIKDLESGLGDHLLRGADYTNKTKQLAEARREAETWLQNERQKIQSERNELKNWYGQVQGELSTADRLREEKEAINARLAAAEQALKDYQIHDQVNLPPINSVNKTTPTPSPTPTPHQPTQTPGQFLTRDEFDRAVSGFMVLQNKIDKIRGQHLKLFGEPLEDDLVTHFQQTGQDPEEYWKVKHAVDNKRAEVETKNREAEYARLKEEARVEVLKEISLDPNRVVGSPSNGLKGGLGPILEQYSHSRALANSQNHANDNPSPKAEEFVPPEKRSEIPAARERIAGASAMFAEHFDLMGNPTTEQGRRLYQKYQG